MRYHVSGHGVYHPEYHIVWVCKYRRRILKPGVAVYVEKTLRGLLRRMPGVTIETIGFDHDHLHMVMAIPPKYAVSDVVAQLKSQSAGYLRRKFAWLERVHWKENVVWSPGFFASSVGLDEATIKHYVEYQGRQDEGRHLFLP
jgi:putative transposase